MATTHRKHHHITYLKQLEQAGFEDVHLIQRETADRVLTEARMELVEAISTTEFESVRALSRHVDRDVSIVSRDLDVLYEAGVIDFETDGRAKKPTLAHQNVLVQPIIFDGQVIGDDGS